MSPSGVSDASTRGGRTGHFWEWLALLFSIAALLGSLYLSLGLKLKACPLCLYQRTFLMGVVGVLLMGRVFWRQAQPGSLAMLGFPLAVGGLAVALFHVGLEWRGVLECPRGLAGIGPAPQQSLAAFVLLCGLLVAAGGRGTGRAAGIWHWVAGAVLGVAFAAGGIVSAPPLPPPPAAPYETPLESCRRPFVPPGQP